MVPEAPLEQTGMGLWSTGKGRFVLDVREACRRNRKGFPPVEPTPFRDGGLPGA